jgi:hypothetical protein
MAKQERGVSVGLTIVKTCVCFSAHLPVFDVSNRLNYKRKPKFYSIADIVETIANIENGKVRGKADAGLDNCQLDRDAPFFLRRKKSVVLPYTADGR